MYWLILTISLTSYNFKNVYEKTISLKYVGTNLKIILLDYQNNCRNFKHDKQCYERHPIVWTFYIIILIV